MINVVAAVITDENNKILITQRNFRKLQGGLWEFPGGKIESGETKEEAIIREIKEELDINIRAEQYIDEKTFNYPEISINLIAIKCSIIDGNIVLKEHEDAKWVNKSEFKNYNFAPADEFIINTLLEPK